MCSCTGPAKNVRMCQVFSETFYAFTTDSVGIGIMFLAIHPFVHLSELILLPQLIS